VEALRAGLRGTAEERAAVFSVLLDRSLDRTFRMAAVILGNRADAEDAVADASLRAWRHVAGLRDPDRFDAWFTRIVVNVCRDRLHQRPGPVALVMEPVVSEDPIGVSIERAALYDALAGLTGEQRAVVALHYLEGMTDEQVAAQLSLPIGTVKSRLHYAVLALRAEYDAASREPMLQAPAGTRP
jgi:RNA polymerase sigma-70 factor (ECF subfamily)